MITLRFTGGLGAVGQLIQLATWSWCSHVDIELHPQWLLGALPGDGVVMRAPEETARVERYSIGGLSAADERAVLRFAEAQLGKPYDWPGVLGWGLRQRNWQQDDSWFCSELVAWAFLQAGHPLLRAEDAWRITPRDLLLSPYLIPLEATADGGRGASTPRAAGRTPA